MEGPFQSILGVLIIITSSLWSGGRRLLRVYEYLVSTIQTITVFFIRV